MLHLDIDSECLLVSIIMLVARIFPIQYFSCFSYVTVFLSTVLAKVIATV